ncbi:GTPase ObgE [Candidatus Parcubacteria bacterium]|jgi:GTP-binding protein|nr:MAG: GTPase ObgE [Candidatus Parcubacteria bacterium]
MLIDDVQITVHAGNGGNGNVSFNKNLGSLGPVGGSGGRGGDVIFEGIADLSALQQFRNQKVFHAKNGEQGKQQFNDGADADDLVLRVPVGTVIHNLDINMDMEIIKIGERVTVARGGRGGKGNFHFRSSTNTTPKFAQDGLPGESYKLRIELKLIADVGLIGLPNAGKSSLLNELTRASAKVANYPFTTLEPNLGVFFNVILADIPGLIEGASTGKGLGTKFLRHVERTETFFHLISAESDDVVRDYATIKKELIEHNPALGEKKEYIFLSKCDTIVSKEVEDKLKALKKKKIVAHPLSILMPETIENVKKILETVQKEKEV